LQLIEQLLLFLQSLPVDLQHALLQLVLSDAFVYLQLDGVELVLRTHAVLDGWPLGLRLGRGSEGGDLVADGAVGMGNDPLLEQFLDGVAVDGVDGDCDVGGGETAVELEELQVLLLEVRIER
jgi:hypothetical protein